jgi:hypothetical protein
MGSSIPVGLSRLLSPALLSGLIVADALSNRQTLVFDARLPGVGAAGVVLVVAPLAAAVARATSRP